MAADCPELNIDDLVQNATTTAQMEDLVAALKQRTQFYKEENEKMTSTLKKLNFLNDDLHITINSDSLDKICAVQEHFKTKDANVNSFALAFSDQQRKHSKHYLSKLRVCLKMYVNLNEKIASQIRHLQSELKESKTNVVNWPCFSLEELKNMEAKIRKYENELVKFEHKYPWLKSPELNMLNIAKDIETLTSLKKEKESLLEELDVYKGLKPNIKEAMQQLADIKIESQKCNEQFMQRLK